MSGWKNQADQLLDLIYDAAAENDLWPSILTAIADLTRSEGGILYGLSLTPRRVHIDYNGRLSEECDKSFRERHMQNSWSNHMDSEPAGRVVFSDDIVRLADLQATAFYDEVLRPQGVSHNAMAALAARNDFLVAFNICRTTRQGAFGNDELKILQRLMPHLRRSVTLGFRIEGYQALQRAAFDVLDQLSDGVILLDRDVRVLFANAAARAFEADGTLNLRRGITTHVDSNRLAELMRLALEGKAGGSMSLAGKAEGQRLSILVTSIRGKDIGRLSDLAMKDAAVLVFVINPANRTSIPIRRIMDAHGLTRAEARVALASTSGKTVAETAGLLELSPNTVKTHLRHVFAKTDTRRQTELANLITSAGYIQIPDDAD